eukprot:COSAG02_NODE_3850_length_6147_cov_7.419478_12_plen_69_part_00
MRGRSFSSNAQQHTDRTHASSLPYLLKVASWVYPLVMGQNALPSGSCVITPDSLGVMTQFITDNHPNH